MQSKPSNKPGRLWSTLAGYYGFLQSVHLVVLALGLVRLLRSGTLGFPAPPPSGGWSLQAQAFLVGNGVLDAFIAIAALIYTFGFFTRKPWSGTLGLICVTASLCSGAFFVFGTVSSGAWQAHPVNYIGLVLVFLPVVGFFLFIVQAEFKS